MRFAQKIEPTCVEVCGEQVKLLFTLRAAAIMEETFETDYLSVVYRAVGLDPATGEKAKAPLTAREQAELVAILASEGGTEVDIDELMSLPMTEFTILAKGAVEEIVSKSTRSKKKQTAKAVAK